MESHGVGSWLILIKVEVDSTYSTSGPYGFKHLTSKVILSYHHYSLGKLNCNNQRLLTIEVLTFPPKSAALFLRASRPMLLDIGLA